MPLILKPVVHCSRTACFLVCTVLSVSPASELLFHGKAALYFVDVEIRTQPEIAFYSRNFLGEFVGNWKNFAFTEVKKWPLSSISRS